MASAYYKALEAESIIKRTQCPVQDPELGKDDRLIMKGLWPG